MDCACTFKTSAAGWGIKEKKESPTYFSLRGKMVVLFLRKKSDEEKEQSEALRLFSPSGETSSGGER